MTGEERSGPELLRAASRLPQAQRLLAALEPEPAVYLVGGAVRDLLLGRVPAELDLVVEGDSLPVAVRLGGDVRPHERFGTVTVRVDEATFDLASSRRERYARPGALPEVEPAPLAEDLRRRDFTVNALALGLSPSVAGELHGVPEALEDLRRGLLRVLHERSFRDDPTRLLRLARYTARLGFTPEPHTAELVRAALRERALETVSGARLGAELRLLSSEDDPIRALAALSELGLDRAIERGFGLRDRRMAERALSLVPPDGRRGPLILGLAVEGVPAGRRERLVERLAFRAADRDLILAVAAGAGALADTLSLAVRPSQIGEAAGRVPVELVAAAGARAGQAQAQAWLADLRHVRLEISGEDLVAAGVPRGPAVARGLRGALSAKLDGQVTDRPGELAAALAAAGADGGEAG